MLKALNSCIACGGKFDLAQLASMEQYICLVALTRATLLTKHTGG
jgi:hypothetical protein